MVIAHVAHSNSKLCIEENSGKVVSAKVTVQEELQKGNGKGEFKDNVNFA